MESADSDLRNMPEEQIRRLWSEVSRHHTPEHIRDLLAGRCVPNGVQEKRLVEVGMKMINERLFDAPVC